MPDCPPVAGQTVTQPSLAFSDSPEVELNRCRCVDRFHHRRPSQLDGPPGECFPDGSRLRLATNRRHAERWILLLALSSRIELRLTAARRAYRWMGKEFMHKADQKRVVAKLS